MQLTGAQPIGKAHLPSDRHLVPAVPKVIYVNLSIETVTLAPIHTDDLFFFYAEIQIIFWDSVDTPSISNNDLCTYCMYS